MKLLSIALPVALAALIIANQVASAQSPLPRPALPPATYPVASLQMVLDDEAEVDRLAAQVARLEKLVAQLSRPRTPDPAPALAARVTALEAQLARAGQLADRLGKALDAIESGQAPRPPAQPPVPPPALPPAGKP